MATPDIVYIVIFVAASLAAITKKLTISGAVAGFVVAISIFGGGGLTTLFELTAFFMLATCATALGLSKKQAMGIAEERKGRRTAGQVFANGGLAALLGIVGILYQSGLFYIPQQWPYIMPVMVAGSLAAATADTLSSELGNVYGKRFYNVITFKSDTRGLDGVISLEGTLAGIAGAAIMGFIYFAFTHHLLSAIFVFVSGVFGNLIDSILGATLERRGLLTNNWVNFLNTFVGAIMAGLLYIIWR